jgi:hypothetical protein
MNICGAIATFAAKQRTCTIQTSNPNHDMPGPDNATTGHYDGEYHWITPIPLIGPLPRHEYTNDPCPCWDD